MDDEKPSIGKIKKRNDGLWYICHTQYGFGNWFIASNDNNVDYSIAVIGNIYENSMVVDELFKLYKRHKK